MFFYVNFYLKKKVRCLHLAVRVVKVLMVWKGIRKKFFFLMPLAYSVEVMMPMVACKSSRKQWCLNILFLYRNWIMFYKPLCTVPFLLNGIVQGVLHVSVFRAGSFILIVAQQYFTDWVYLSLTSPLLMDAWVIYNSWLLQIIGF